MESSSTNNEHIDVECGGDLRRTFWLKPIHGQGFFPCRAAVKQHCNVLKVFGFLFVWPWRNIWQNSSGCLELEHEGFPSACIQTLAFAKVVVAGNITLLLAIEVQERFPIKSGLP